MNDAIRVIDPALLLDGVERSGDGAGVVAICEQKIHLSRRLSDTLTALYRARSDYEFARRVVGDKLAVAVRALSDAREAASAAEAAYEAHVAEHHC